MSAPTIVVKFGESVSDGEFFLVELDDTLNTNVPRGRILGSYVLQGVQYYIMYFGVGDIRTLPAEGVKSQFNPGDRVHFLMHFDPLRLRVSDIRCTAGQVVLHSQVSRTATDEVLFAEAGVEQSLGHIPDGNPSVAWFGRSTVLTRSGRSITPSDAPCIARISYSYRAISGEFVPPPMTIAGDDSYPVAIVVYVEAA